MLEQEWSVWLLWAEPGFPACNKLEPIVTANEVEVATNLVSFVFRMVRLQTEFPVLYYNVYVQFAINACPGVGASRPSVADRLLFFNIVQIIRLFSIPF